MATTSTSKEHSVSGKHGVSSLVDRDLNQQTTQDGDGADDQSKLSRRQRQRRNKKERLARERIQADQANGATLASSTEKTDHENTGLTNGESKDEEKLSRSKARKLRRKRRKKSGNSEDMDDAIEAANSIVDEIVDVVEKLVEEADPESPIPVESVTITPIAKKIIDTKQEQQTIAKQAAPDEIKNHQSDPTVAKASTDTATKVPTTNVTHVETADAKAYTASIESKVANDEGAAVEEITREAVAKVKAEDPPNTKSHLNVPEMSDIDEAPETATLTTERSAFAYAEDITKPEKEDCECNACAVM